VAIDELLYRADGAGYLKVGNDPHHAAHRGGGPPHADSESEQLYRR
jgi:hypothetical protein